MFPQHTHPGHTHDVVSLPMTPTSHAPKAAPTPPRTRAREVCDSWSTMLEAIQQYQNAAICWAARRSKLLYGLPFVACHLAFSTEL